MLDAQNGCKVCQVKPALAFATGSLPEEHFKILEVENGNLGIDVPAIDLDQHTVYSDVPRRNY